ncbi:hypothetical protein ACQJBY_035247 [Aegilops geniculata]
MEAGSARGVPNLEVRSAFTTGASATRTRLAFHLRWCCDDLLKYGSARARIERWSMAVIMRIAEHVFSITVHTLRYFQSIGVHKYKTATLEAWITYLVLYPAAGF